MGHRSVVILALLVAPAQEFHQGVDYRIEARLDEATNVLTGRAQMRYTNRSPDTLDTLYFHLHLNAFRPNSAWATRELQFQSRGFQDLGPTEHAFDRMRSIRIDGRPVTPVFPYAPDSTVMAVPLPARLAPNGSLVVDMEWESRLSEKQTRRQGRLGRHYDWAHWYPRIAVYDTAGWQVNRLVRQGEFFGEFASYDVTLDIAADQIVAATGVPVSGDPGWTRVNRTPAKPPVLQRDAYQPTPEKPLGLLSAPGTGRKHIRWRAHNVHHFAWSTDPAYVYQGDRIGDVALHLLVLPTDTAWANALRELKQSVAFFDSVLGPYAYPQLTAARRIDRGATEFPMFTTHDVTPAINHETAHQWAHAILANNEFREGWLDEGLAQFLGDLYAQSKGARPRFNVAAIALMDSAGISQPIALPAAQFRDFNTYQQMTYIKPSIVFNMLRWLIGDAVFRRGLRLYHERNKFQHVDENDFRTAMETVAGTDLDWFFAQWIHTTNTLDYAVTNVETRQVGRRWRTRVEITRSGAIWMPVDLKVGDEVIRIDTHDRVYNAFVETTAKPEWAVLDPERILID
ncbi:MAG: M1 family metallopeptidase, partial [Gemmatimonadota bacterium]